MTRFVSFSVLLGILACLASPSAGEDVKEPKAITLPKDPMAVVLSYDPGEGGFIRKGPPPYLLIRANGETVVTNVLDGAKQQAKLTPQQVQELLAFVIRDQDFFQVTAAKIADGVKEAAQKGVAIAVGGAGTSTITVEAMGKKHEVSYRGAGAYLQAYPNVRPLAQYVAVEKRLNELGVSLTKAK